MTLFIHTLHWDRVPADCNNSWQRWNWVYPHYSVFAIWPAPVVLNERFKKAGFEDFAPLITDDVAWDTELEEITLSLISKLSDFGTPILRCGWQQPESVLSEIRKLLFHWSSNIKKDLSIEELTDILTFPMYDDHLPQTVVEFGSKPTASVRAYAGHEIIWLGLSDSHADKIEALVGHMASERSVKRTRLDWSILAI